VDVRGNGGGTGHHAADGMGLRFSFLAGAAQRAEAWEPREASVFFSGAIRGAGRLVLWRR
jgi:hypothetical protein